MRELILVTENGAIGEVFKMKQARARMGLAFEKAHKELFIISGSNKSTQFIKKCEKFSLAKKKFQ